MVKYIASPLLYNSVSNVQRRRNATEMCEVMSAKGSSIIPKHSFRPQHSEQGICVMILWTTQPSWMQKITTCCSCSDKQSLASSTLSDSISLNSCDGVLLQRGLYSCISAKATRTPTNSPFYPSITASVVLWIHLWPIQSIQRACKHPQQLIKMSLPGLWGQISKITTEDWNSLNATGSLGMN